MCALFTSTSSSSQDDVNSDHISQENIITRCFRGNRIPGTDGNDMIIGILDIETINGDAVNDILHGGIGSDKILSRTDNDVIVGALDDGYLVDNEG